MQETLEQLLARLKAEIEEAEHGDVDRAELARLARAVEAKLAETGADKAENADDDDDDDSLSEDLREGVVRWESSHPDLANFLHQAADTLGGIGI